jgi:hypothetical protein
MDLSYFDFSVSHIQSNMHVLKNSTLYARLLCIKLEISRLSQSHDRPVAGLTNNGVAHITVFLNTFILA